MEWLNDLLREVRAEQPGMIFGSPEFDKQEVLDYLQDLEET